MTADGSETAQGNFGNPVRNDRGETFLEFLPQYNTPENFIEYSRKVKKIMLNSSCNTMIMRRYVIRYDITFVN